MFSVILVALTFVQLCAPLRLLLAILRRHVAAPLPLPLRGVGRGAAAPGGDDGDAAGDNAFGGSSGNPRTHLRNAGVGAQLAEPVPRGLHSSTFRLKVITVCGII